MSDTTELDEMIAALEENDCNDELGETWQCLARLAGYEGYVSDWFYRSLIAEIRQQHRELVKLKAEWAAEEAALLAARKHTGTIPLSEIRKWIDTHDDSEAMMASFDDFVSIAVEDGMVNP